VMAVSGDGRRYHFATKPTRAESTRVVTCSFDLGVERLVVGRVRDHEEVPIPTAFVELRASDRVTGGRVRRSRGAVTAAGRFLFAVDPEQELEVFARHEGVECSRPGVRAGQTDLEVTLDLSGLTPFLLQRHGLPIERYHIGTAFGWTEAPTMFARRAGIGWIHPKATGFVDWFRVCWREDGAIFELLVPRPERGAASPHVVDVDRFDARPSRRVHFRMGGLTDVQVDVRGVEPIPPGPGCELRTLFGGGQDRSLHGVCPGRYRVEATQRKGSGFPLVRDMFLDVAGADVDVDVGALLAH
jgi:hypothetical protein